MQCDLEAAAHYARSSTKPENSLGARRARASLQASRITFSRCRRQRGALERAQASGQLCSIAKTTPGNGALKAAATPAAPPATRRALLSRTVSGPRPTSGVLHHPGSDLDRWAFPSNRQPGCKTCCAKSNLPQRQAQRGEMKSLSIRYEGSKTTRT